MFKEDPVLGNENLPPKAENVKGPEAEVTDPGSHKSILRGTYVQNQVMGSQNAKAGGSGRYAELDRCRSKPGGIYLTFLKH